MIKRMVMKIPKRRIVVIAHDLRSCYNVGSLLRTAKGLGITYLYLTGYTPYPPVANDTRLPYLAAKIGRKIHKTALGAENTLNWSYEPSVRPLLTRLKKEGFIIAALEQTRQAQPLTDFKPPPAVALLLGREVGGISPKIIEKSDIQLFIPMLGNKDSFNVAQAAAMALYHFRFSRD